MDGFRWRHEGGGPLTVDKRGKVLPTLPNDLEGKADGSARNVQLRAARCAQALGSLRDAHLEMDRLDAIAAGAKADDDEIAVLARVAGLLVGVSGQTGSTCSSQDHIDHLLTLI